MEKKIGEQYIYQYNITVIKATIYQFEVYIALLEVPDLRYHMKFYSIWNIGLTDCQTLKNEEKYMSNSNAHGAMLFTKSKLTESYWSVQGRT